MEQLGWVPLEEQGTTNKVTMLFKAINGQVVNSFTLSSVEDFSFDRKTWGVNKSIGSLGRNAQNKQVIFSTANFH